MPKFTREELSKRVDDLDIDDEVKVSLMEDIYDSMEDKESEELSKLKEELDKTKADYDDLLSKYKERFFASDDKEVDEEEKIEVEDEEVIDVKELF